MLERAHCLMNPFWRVSVSLGKSSKFVFDAPLDSLSTLSSPVVLGWPQPSWVRRFGVTRNCVHGTGRIRSVCGHGHPALSEHRRARACHARVPCRSLAGCAASRGVRPWPAAAWPRCRMSATLGWPTVVPCAEPSRGCPGSDDVAPPHPSASPTPSGSRACATAAAWRLSGPDPGVKACASAFLPH
jgi:hypothetical protein